MNVTLRWEHFGMQALAEETMRADRAERTLGEMRVAQANWEQELQQKDKTNAEQVTQHTCCWPSCLPYV
jgi:hypothetical protein